MHTATGAMWPTWRRVHDPQRRLTPHGIRCGIGNLWNSCADPQRLVMARFLRHWLKYHHNTIIGTMHIQVVESVNFWKVNIVWTDCWFLILHFSEFQCCAQANLSLDWNHLIHLFDMHMEGVYCFLAPAAVSTCSVIFWERQFLCLTLHVPTTSIFWAWILQVKAFFSPGPHLSYVKQLSTATDTMISAGFQRHWYLVQLHDQRFAVCCSDHWGLGQADSNTGHTTDATWAWKVPPWWKTFLVEIAFIAPTQDVNAWSLMTGASTMAGRSLRDGYSNGKIIQLNVFFK